MKAKNYYLGLCTFFSVFALLTLSGMVNSEEYLTGDQTISTPICQEKGDQPPCDGLVDDWDYWTTSTSGLKAWFRTLTFSKR